MNASPYDWMRHARTLYTAYLANEQTTNADLLDISKALAGCKMGVVHTDAEFIKFLLKFQNDLRRLSFDSKEIQQLVMYSCFLNIKDHKYWEFLFNAIIKKEKDYNIASKLFMSKLFLQTKSCQDRLKLILPLINDTLKQAIAPKTLSTLQYDNLVDFAVCVTKLSLKDYANVYPVVFDHAYKNKTILDQNLSANSLSDLGYVLYKGIPANDEVRSTITAVAHAYQHQDEISYDAVVQDYEFRDQRPSSIGLIDMTRWPNVANMVMICSDPEYCDHVLLSRFEESIFRKSESDLIDFDSAVKVLSSLQKTSLVNPTFWMRVLQMLQMQFENEGVSQLAHFDGDNITTFLDTLLKTYNSDMDLGLYQLFFEYFEGLLRAGDIPNKFTYENLKQIYTIYEKAFFYRLKVDTFFKTLQQRIDAKKPNGSS